MYFLSVGSVASCSQRQQRARQSSFSLDARRREGTDLDQADGIVVCKVSFSLSHQPLPGMMEGRRVTHFQIASFLNHFLGRPPCRGASSTYTIQITYGMIKGQKAGIELMFDRSTARDAVQDGVSRRGVSFVTSFGSRGVRRESKE